MKKFLLVPLAFIFTLSSCVEENTKNGNEEIIPNGITERGVLGSWAYGIEDEELSPLIAKEWYIEGSRVTVAHVCDFGEGPVTAAVQVRSEIRGSILTLLENQSKTVTSGELSCSVSVSENSSYTLNLTSSNVLRITRSGTTETYTH
ncbi:MAG: hypothetical protein R3A80_13895 [Bdellovibrionota bacterium]